MRACSCGVNCDDDTIHCTTCGARLSTAVDSSRAHAVGEVFGSYRLIRLIGQGGMGRVYVAEHTRLGRLVALKMLRSEYSDNAEAVKRFFAEARAVNRINHENIIEISDFVENAGGRSFYIMELLKGHDLRALKEREGALPIGRALGIGIQICRGLGAVHDAGIVHRDLKPDNIFVVDRGERKDFVKLLDFGVAKLVDDRLDEISSYKTTAGVVVGTPEYMSPEQASGSHADLRSDIYSVGVILFEMITGHRPFEGPTAREVMAQHVLIPAPRPSKILRFGRTMPSALEDVILACLKKDPGDRPQSMKEIESRLTAIAQRLSVAVASEDLPRSRWRDRRYWKVAGAVAVLGLVGMGFMMRRERAPTRRARGDRPTSTERAPASPSPTAAPPSLKRVRIAFGSAPEGASVSRAGQDRPLGTTPFTAWFDVSPAASRFEFSKAGWQAKRQDVMLLGDTHVDVALKPVEEAEAHRAIGKPASKSRAALSSGMGISPEGKLGELDHDAVLNPFE
jgi:serine/threonine-protein kinase